MEPYTDNDISWEETNSDDNYEKMRDKDFNAQTKSASILTLFSRVRRSSDDDTSDKNAKSGKTKAIKKRDKKLKSW